MFTIKHVSPEGYESLYEAIEVNFKPANALQQTQTAPAADILWYTCPGTKEIRSIDNGFVYVTNETGATVAKYNLSDGRFGSQIDGGDRSNRPLPEAGTFRSVPSGC